jgi:hypothetical protein
MYPLLPYAQKYVVAANQKGLVNAVLDALSGASGTENMKMLWSGAKGILSRDFRQILRDLIQVECLPFRPYDVPYVFLHDAFTDLALALELRGIFEFYMEEIPKLVNAQPAFTTKNLPLFLQRCQEYGLGTPLVMTHVNACGFSMNPSREAVESALGKSPARVMAMSTLASGHLKPREAFSYLAGVQQIESVVVGASSRAHIQETVEAIRTCFLKESNQPRKRAA